MSHQDDTTLLDLLAVIHRDGGQYTTEHGVQASWQEAHRIIYTERHRLEQYEAFLQQVANPEPPFTAAASEWHYGYNAGRESLTGTVRNVLGDRYVRPTPPAEAEALP